MSQEEPVMADLSARREGRVVRVFFALTLPEAHREGLARIVAGLRRRPDGDAVHWVRPANLHLTLRFLGNVDADGVPELVERARERLEAEASATVVKLGEPFPFPSARRPRVVALSASPEEPLARMAAILDEVAVGCGLAPERRGFRAHVTLGRLRGRRLPDLGAVVTEPAELPVQGVTLYRSDLHRDGARYEPLVKLPLGPAADTRSPQLSTEKD
jgi:2'-5' RNA ligase